MLVFLNVCGLAIGSTWWFWTTWCPWVGYWVYMVLHDNMMSMGWQLSLRGGSWQHDAHGLAIESTWRFLTTWCPWVGYWVYLAVFDNMMPMVGYWAYLVVLDNTDVLLPIESTSRFLTILMSCCLLIYLEVLDNTNVLLSIESIWRLSLSLPGGSWQHWCPCDNTDVLLSIKSTWRLSFEYTWRFLTTLMSRGWLLRYSPWDIWASFPFSDRNGQNTA